MINSRHYYDPLRLLALAVLELCLCTVYLHCACPRYTVTMHSFGCSILSLVACAHIALHLFACSSTLALMLLCVFTWFRICLRAWLLQCIYFVNTYCIVRNAVGWHYGWYPSMFACTTSVCFVLLNPLIFFVCLLAGNYTCLSHVCLSDVCLSDVCLWSYILQPMQRLFGSSMRQFPMCTS